MANILEGKPDDRQSRDVEQPVSRFRPRSRGLTDEEMVLHDAIKAKAAEMENLLNQVKPGRYSALALTALEEAVMWGIKGLTS